MRPQQAQTVQLKQLQRQPPPRAEAVRVAPPKSTARVISRAVSAKGPIKRKATAKRTISYKTRDPTPESHAKISMLRNQGQGRYLVIIGNGPSIAEADLGKLKAVQGVDVISINKPDERVWPTKYWAFFDRTQYRRHEGLWHGYDGYIFNSTSIAEQKQKSMQFKFLNGPGWSRDLIKGLHIGRSSVFAALQIAFWMNYQQIFVFGCDMNPDGIDGKLHFYGVNPDVDPKVRAERFAKEAESYTKASEILDEAERSKIVFCTTYNKWPFVEKFGRLDHRTAVEHILQLARGAQ